MKTRFCEDEIIGILQFVEKSGQKVRDACREKGISEQTYYRWKSKYAGMDVSEVRRLKAGEAENAKLKRILADQRQDFVTKDRNFKDHFRMIGSRY